MPYRDAEARRACDARYRARNLAARRKANRDYAIQHPDRMAASTRRWNRRRRARVFERDGWACVYCGSSGTGETLTIDHKVPLSKGGANALENSLTACRSCNCRKGQKSYRAFMAQIQAERTIARGEPPPWVTDPDPLLEVEEA